MRRTNGRLKIAIQKSGRLTDDALGLLRGCGLEFDIGRNSLHAPCGNFPLDILALRDDDIPEYVMDGVAELGIVGRNIVVEKGATVETLAELGFGACRLMICVPVRSNIRAAGDLAGRRIATTYPTILADYLRREKIDCEIVPLSGAVELAPMLDVADAICDLVSTGSTARINGLRPLETVLDSSAVLVAGPAAMAEPRKRKLIDRLLIRIQAGLIARGKRYVMLNAPATAVPQLQRIVPGLASPTIVPLADDGMVALHSVVPQDVFWDTMEQLRDAGARDIIVMPIGAIIR